MKSTLFALYNNHRDAKDRHWNYESFISPHSPFHSLSPRISDISDRGRGEQKISRIRSDYHARAPFFTIGRLISSSRAKRTRRRRKYVTRLLYPPPRQIKRSENSSTAHYALFAGGFPIGPFPSVYWILKYREEEENNTRNRSRMCVCPYVRWKEDAPNWLIARRLLDGGTTTALREGL